MEYNLKPREVWCRHCKQIIITSEVNIRCTKCNSDMITVLYSLIDGRRLTGSDELGKPSC